MCGRYAINKETDEMITEFVAQGGKPEDWRPLYSVAPTDRAPIVREREDDQGVQRELTFASWGFRPSWSKSKGLAPINARLETAATNGMFRSSFAKYRCIVPMVGYYEWQAQSDGKQPYFLHHGEKTLAAAGLYVARKVDDDWQLSFTIITRTARDAAGEVHDRMPVFLDSELRDWWLNPKEMSGGSDATSILDQSSKEVAREISSHAVSRRVNSVQAIDPTDAELTKEIAL